MIISWSLKKIKDESSSSDESGESDKDEETLEKSNKKVVFFRHI